MRSKQIWISFLAIVIIGASCKKSSTDDGGNTLGAQSFANIAYGTDPLQKMDVYLPAGRTAAATKVVVMIHGGGWTTGDKSEAFFARFVDTIKRRLPDYAIFNINYRLSAAPTNLFPTQENDVKAALEFIFSKSVEYQISNKYVLLGASAGAHLAMLQAYKYNTPVKPKVVVSFFGPSDLEAMYNDPVGGNPLLSLGLAQAIGATPVTNPAIYTSSSPLNFINVTNAVPTILLHGGADQLVKPSQSTIVRDKLSIAGIANQYVFYPTGGHGDWTDAVYSDAFNKIEPFVRSYTN